MLLEGKRHFRCERMGFLLLKKKDVLGVSVSFSSNETVKM